MSDIAVDPRRGRWIPWVFVAAFLVVVAANGVLVAIATSTFNGLTTDNAFTEGLAFNDTLDDAADQARLGWVMVPSFRADGGQAGELAVAATAPNGSALTGATVTAWLTRPTQAGFDFAVDLAARGAGRYGATIAFPLPGVWDARIELARDGHVVRQVRRLVVR